MDGLACSFVHKKLLGVAKAAISTFVPGGSTALTIGSSLFGGGGGGNVGQTFRPRARFSAADIAGAGVHLQHGHTQATAGHQWLTPELVALAPRVPGNLMGGRGAQGPCPGITSVRGPGGTCVELNPLANRITPQVTGGPAAAVAAAGPVGEVVMGRFGAAYVPASRMIDQAVCLPGDVVGKDGLCYPKKSLTNKERMWPRGARPLGTPGEMAAVAKASRFATRFKNTEKRLKKLGMVKASAPRAAPKKKQQLALPPGITVVDTSN